MELTDPSSPFTPENPHLSVALVMTGTFMQLADPLDWAARRLGLEVKVDRGELAESLAYSNHGRAGLAAPVVVARGLDRRTHFKLEVIGRCEGKMVAQCRISFDPLRHALKEFEDAAVSLTVLNTEIVLGVQGTAGAKYHPLAARALAREKTFLRLLPLNVFGKSYFGAQLAALQRDKHVEFQDCETAVLVKLAQSWLFYDMPIPRSTPGRSELLLPFQQTDK